LDRVLNEVRLLNDVQFAAVIDAIMKGTFGVRATYVEKVGINLAAYENRTKDYSFDRCGSIIAATFPLVDFMRDVEQIVAEHVELNRLDGEVRAANKQFADENQRLNTRLNNERAANLTWEERYNAVKGKRDSLELDVRAANNAVVAIRERAAGVEQERIVERADMKQRVTALQADLDEAVEQIKALTLRNETQSESIGRYQEENERLALNVKSLMNALAAHPDTQAATRERQLRDRIENQRTSIIEFHREQSAWRITDEYNKKLCAANEQYVRDLAVAEKRINQLEAERAQLPPDFHVLAAGDTVALKGMRHAPKMTVTNIGDLVQCAFWNRDNSCFEWANFAEGALSYFAPETPSDAKSESAPIVQVGTPGNMELRPLTVSKETLATAIKNGRQMIFGKTKDFDTLRACFDVIADEVSAHVAIG